MSLKSWLLLGPALGLALGQQSTYPTNLTFERWTTPQGELIQLDGRGQTSRPYRVTALSRLDPNRPGFLLQPLVNSQNTTVRTYDQKVTLNSLQETPAWVYYNPTSVAYLKIDYTHSGLSNVWMYWDGQQLYGKYNGIDYGNALWVALGLASFWAISLFWIPTGGGEFHTTLPIPLDGQTHVLYFGGGGDCTSFNGEWKAYYKVDSSRMQAGKIYWVEARNGCNNPGIVGSLIQVTNPVRVDYQVSGLPALVSASQYTPGWYDPTGALGMVQWRYGWYPSLTGEEADGHMSPGSAAWQGIWVPPHPELKDATTIPYYDPNIGYITASWRYEVHKVRKGDSAIVNTFGNQLNQFTLNYCGGWDQDPDTNRWVCTGGTAQATYGLTSSSQERLLIDLNRPAFDGAVFPQMQQGTDSNGNPVRYTTLWSNPVPVLQTYTVRESFQCVSGSCP